MPSMLATKTRLDSSDLIFPVSALQRLQMMISSGLKPPVEEANELLRGTVVCIVRMSRMTHYMQVVHLGSIGPSCGTATKA